MPIELKRICVTGTPGTGKTVVGKALARELGYGFVEVNELAQRLRAVRGYDRKRESRIVGTKRMGPAVRRMERVVLAGHFAHELPCDCIVVLRCGLPELRARLERRGWSERKVRENVEAELFGVVEEEARGKGKRMVVVDTTRKGAERVVKEVARAFKVSSRRSRAR